MGLRGILRGRWGKIAAVRNAKCKKSSACAVFGGFGGACFALTYLLCAAWFGGAWKSLKSRCVGALEALISGGLQRFCKICAKMARFCATICADRFRSCYLKAVPDCAKCLRLGRVPMQCAKCLRLLGFVLGLAVLLSLSLGLQACSRGLAFAL